MRRVSVATWINPARINAGEGMEWFLHNEVPCLVRGMSDHTIRDYAGQLDDLAAAEGIRLVGTTEFLFGLMAFCR